MKSNFFNWILHFGNQKRGYYPFSREPDFQLKLQQVIIQTLEQDIPAYAQMNISTGRKLKRLMAVIAQSVPFKPNMSKLICKLPLWHFGLMY